MGRRAQRQPPRRPGGGDHAFVRSLPSSEVVEDQYFDDSSVLRRVHREHVVALSGPRALLMQAAHPVAFAGFFMSTGALGDPYRRLRRTADVLDTVIWGS